MIYILAGMGITAWLGYKAAEEYAAIAPALSAAKGFGALFHPKNPQGPSSLPTSNGKAAQNQ